MIDGNNDTLIHFVVTNDNKGNNVGKNDPARESNTGFFGYMTDTKNQSATGIKHCHVY